MFALNVTPYIEGTVFPDKSLRVNKTPVFPVREQICSKSMTVVALVIYWNTFGCNKKVFVYKLTLPSE